MFEQRLKNMYNVRISLSNKFECTIKITSLPFHSLIKKKSQQKAKDDDNDDDDDNFKRARDSEAFRIEGDHHHTDLIFSMLACDFIFGLNPTDL